jgi:hypothetical protein
MKIVVVDYIKDMADGYIVKFNSPFGSAKGKWVGTRPILNFEYYIEIDIPGILEWGKQIIEIYEEISQITSDDNHIYLSGVLESVDSDGYSVLRIGNNIVAFELTGNNYPIGSYVKVVTEQISLFDMKI